MANPIVLTGFANPDPNAAPLNITELIKLLNQLVVSEIVGNYTPYVLGHNTPSVEDQDKVWFALDPSGRPLGFFTFYNGGWRRAYNGMIGEIRIYSGDPTVDFDAQGRGKVGAQYWYDGWQLCNGNNGSPDLSDKFITCAHLSDLTKGFVGGQFLSNIEGTDQAGNDIYKNTGGVSSITMTLANTYRAARKAIGAYLWTASGNAPADNGDMYGLHNTQTTFKPAYRSDGSVDTDDPGNTTPNKIDIVNPYIAMGLITFIGYQ